MWGTIFPQNMTASQIRSLVVKSLGWADNGLSVQYTFSAAPCLSASGGCGTYPPQIQVQ